jgi:hypothetical protein
VKFSSQVFSNISPIISFPRNLFSKFPMACASAIRFCAVNISASGVSDSAQMNIDARSHRRFPSHGSIAQSPMNNCRARASPRRNLPDTPRAVPSSAIFSMNAIRLIKKRYSRFMIFFVQ